MQKIQVNTCHFQGKRETEAICLLIYFLVETIPENIIDNSKGAAKGVSEEEGDMVSMVTLDNLDGLLFTGSSTALFPFLFINNKLQNNPCQFDCALSPYRQRKREDVLYFSGSA